VAGRGANDLTPERFAVTKPWRRPPRLKRGCSPSKEEEDEDVYYLRIYHIVN
jgi:hypothetical protein